MGVDRTNGTLTLANISADLIGSIAMNKAVSSDSLENRTTAGNRLVADEGIRTVAQRDVGGQASVVNGAEELRRAQPGEAAAAAREGGRGNRAVHLKCRAWSQGVDTDVAAMFLQYQWG